MAGIVPPVPTFVDSQTLAQWHTVFKPSWETLVAIGYVQGALAKNDYTQVTGLTNAQGEVTFDETDQTIAEKELDDDGELLYAVSTDAGDTGTLAVAGINSDGDCDAAEVTLTGTTAVLITNASTDNKWKNVHHARNTSGTPLLGAVAVSTKNGAAPDNTDSIQVLIAIAEEQGFNAMLMAGNDEVEVFHGINVSVTLKDMARVIMWMKMDGVWVLMYTLFIYETHRDYIPKVPQVLTAGQKMVTTVQTATNPISATLEMAYTSLEQDTAVGNGQGVNILF